MFLFGKYDFWRIFQKLLVVNGLMQANRGDMCLFTALNLKQEQTE